MWNLGKSLRVKTTFRHVARTPADARENQRDIGAQIVQ